MHLRYSWTRSMSCCCQRQSSCGTSVGRRERLDRLVDLVVPRHVGHEVADEREGAHRLDGDRLVEVEVGQPRLAGQARPAVDLRAARAALGGLAVPADGEVGRLVALDPVEGVEDDHPLLDRHVELVEVPLLAGAAAEDLAGVRPASDPPVSGRCCRAGSRSSSGIVGQRRRVTVIEPSAPRRDDAVDRAPAAVVGRRDSRAGCARRGSRSAARALRVMASETVSRLSQLEDEVPARVVGPAARRADVRPAPAQLGQLAERLVEVGLDAEDPDQPLHRRPAGRAGSRTGPRPRSARAARRARRVAPPGPGPGRRTASPAVAAAWAAAPAPVRAPNTSRSDSELPPSRFAPCIPPATSPAAYRPGDGRRAGLGIDPDAAHDVVGRRPDLHRPLRDVDVGELLELLVHRRQLAPDVLGRQVADVEEHAAVGRPAALRGPRCRSPARRCPGSTARAAAARRSPCPRTGRSPSGPPPRRSRRTRRAGPRAGTST